MPLSAEAVANELIALSKNEGRPLTNMQLQKLVYIANGFSLALYGKPLIVDSVQAWRYGPVYPELYKQLRKYGAGRVTDLLDADDEVSDLPDEKSLISAVWNSYGNKSAATLSALTHQPNSPWSTIYERQPNGVIPPDSIMEHYRKIVPGHVPSA